MEADDRRVEDFPFENPIGSTSMIVGKMVAEGTQPHAKRMRKRNKDDLPWEECLLPFWRSPLSTSKIGKLQYIFWFSGSFGSRPLLIQLSTDDMYSSANPARSLADGQDGKLQVEE